MQQKVIIIGSQRQGKEAMRLLLENSIQQNIEIISPAEAFVKGIDSTYNTPKERAVIANKVIKEYSHLPEPTRAERRAKQRQLKKKINNYKKRK